MDEQKAQADVDSVNSSMKTVKEKMGSIAARKREKEKECKLIKKCVEIRIVLFGVTCQYVCKDCWYLYMNIVIVFWHLSVLSM